MNHGTEARVDMIPVSPPYAGLLSLGRRIVLERVSNTERDIIRETYPVASPLRR